MSRERLLIFYCLVIGAWGWLWLASLPQTPVVLSVALMFATLALVVDLLSFRVPPADSHSLVGVVLIGATLHLGPVPGAAIAAIEGAISGVALMQIYRAPRTFYNVIARPLLRSGSRVIGLLGGAALGELLAPANPNVLAITLMLGFFVATQSARVLREWLQGGKSGLATWWHSAWRMIIGVELAPLPLAVLGAAIADHLGPLYLALAGMGLAAAAAAVRRAALNLQSQGRSVRELALLNEVSRAIIRSELEVEALCDLIYRETSKIVDTSSFHLGLFESEHYTLMVRVQDRVRLPPLVVTTGDSGLIGWIKRTGKALLVEDFSIEMNTLPARPTYQSDRPPLSGIYVPLIAGDYVIGSISVQSPRARAFGPNDLRLLSLIADQAAVAIARARIYNEARQRAVQLQAIREVSQRITAILNMDALLPSVVRLIRERFGYHPVHIFTIDVAQPAVISFRASTADDEQVAFMRAAPLRMGIGIVGAAAAEGKPLLVGDVLSDQRYIRDSLATRSELAVPLRIGEQVIGVLDVQSDKPDDFDANDLFVMHTLADQIAIAIDSANSYTAQQEEAWTLNALLQVAENVSRVNTLDELLATMVRLPPLLLGSDRCYAFRYEREAHQYELVAAYGLHREQRSSLLRRGFRPDAAPLLDHVRLSSSELDAPHRALEVISTALHPGAFPILAEIANSGTLIALPLTARSSLLGVLLLDFDEIDHMLNPRQTALCTGMAAQFAGALESALLAREADEAARLEEEIRVAREIQTALLPNRHPVVEGWQFAALWRAARVVGGDFYDFWPLPISGWTDPPEGPVLGFVIADVSDKGVPAAMFMAMSRSLVRASALDGSLPAAAMDRANRWITRDSESGMFVTLFYAQLDTGSGRVRYTSAGHNPPIIFRSESHECEELRARGIALGVLDEISLGEAENHLAPGDVLVCYTDGVTEAVNEQLEAFDTTRLKEVIARNHHLSAEEIVQAITSEVDAFTSGQPAFDDLTLVVVKRT